MSTSHKATTVLGSTVEVGFSKEFRNAVALLVEARKAKAEAEKQIKEASDILTKVLETAHAEFGTIGGVKAFKFAFRSRPVIDAKLLAEAYPEAFEATNRITEYDYIDAVR